MSFVNFAGIPFFQDWEARQKQPTDAIPTLFPGLNAICGDDGGGRGLARKWFITIGGGTGQGKSLLAQNLAVGALKLGHSVGFLSLEMSHNQLATRFYAMATNTPIRGLERGRFDPAAAARAWDGMIDNDLSANFFVNTDELETIDDVMAAAAHLVSLGCRVLVLDYMQLVSLGDDETIYRVVTQVAGSLRRFAKKENITVLALSQYNTPTGRDTSAQPTLYGLMGGATIAQNGDMVLLLDHSRYERDQFDHSIARTFLLVPKNRHGDTGEIPILWRYKDLTCREAMPDEVHLWPGERK